MYKLLAVLALAFAVAIGFLGAALLFGDQAAETRLITPTPTLVVHEDGAGFLPPGSKSKVRGDMTGRLFCVQGEACDTDPYGRIGSAVGR